VFILKNLSDTYLFRKDEKVGRTFRENIKKIDWEKDLVSAEYFRNEIDIIKRRFSFTLKQQVINAYENNEIVCIYPNYAKLTRLVPIFLIKNKFIDNDISSVLNLEVIGGIKTKQEEIKIDNKKLYGYLECAYISRELQKTERKFTNNTKIKKLSTNCYVKLMKKVLDKLYAVNLLPEKADRISYLLAKFFLLYVLEQPENDTTNDIAYSCTSGNTPKKLMLSTDLDFSKENYNSLEAFFSALSNYFDVLKNLNLRNFLVEFMNLYGEDATFAIENYQRFLEVVITSCVFSIRGYRDQLVDTTINKDALDLYTEITRVLSRD